MHSWSPGGMSHLFAGKQEWDQARTAANIRCARMADIRSDTRLSSILQAEAAERDFQHLDSKSLISDIR